MARAPTTRRCFLGFGSLVLLPGCDLSSGSSSQTAVNDAPSSSTVEAGSVSTPASTTAAKEQANPSSGGTILAFGDSNTTSTYAESWGVKLGRLTGRRVVVSAKGNETTAGGLGRLAGAIRSSGATTVCIMQGTVDAIKGISASTAAANVARMVGIAKAEGATLVVVGTPPAAPSKSFGAAVSAIASAIASAAAARGARVANVHGATNNKALMIADGFHLNNSGMTTVAGVFADKV